FQMRNVDKTSTVLK
ncbi:TPA: 23S rRNA methyltransferase attenuation leader peptide, partial [Streptococcus suis]